MRAKSSLVGFFCLLVSSLLSADTISSLSPSSIYVGNVEDYLVIRGTSLSGNAGTTVTYSGPSGDFVVPASLASPDVVTVWIPIEVALQAGRYEITVTAYDDPGARVSGPAFFDVVERPVENPPQLTAPESITAEATSSQGAIVTFAVTVQSSANPSPLPSCDHVSGELFPMGTTRVICTTSDQFGSASASFSIFVTDTTAPTLQVPASIVSTTALVSFDVTATDAIDGPVTVVCTPASGSTFIAGSTTVRCSAKDSHANSSTASFVVTFVDPGGPPTITVPDDVRAEATSPAGAIVTYVVDAHQNIAVTCAPQSGTTFAIGATTVQCSATNANGTGTSSFDVHVTDSTPPVLSLPATINAQTTGTSVPVTFTATAADIVDGAVPVVCAPSSGSSFDLGTTLVVCTSADSRGNQSQDVFKVLVTGAAPTLTLPPPIQAEATSAAGAAVTYVASTDPNAQLVCAPVSGSTFPIGTTSVNCTAANASGMTSGSFEVTVADTTPPVLTLPSDITLDATSPAGASVSFTATATDIVDGAVTVTCTPASGATFEIGTTSVNCSATDAHTNRRTGSFHVTVNATAPVLTVPNDFTVEATSSNGALVSYVVTATGGAQVVCAPASGTTFALSATTVHCSATNSGGTASATFVVTVADTTRPVLTLPANITTEATSAQGAPVSFVATASDLVDGNRPVTCTPPSGATFSIGQTMVQCQASDLHGNTASGAFLVTVRDSTAPQIVSINASPNTLWPPNHKMVDVVLTVTATDAGDAHPVSHIVSVTSNQAASPGEADWVITGPLSLQVRSERSNGNDRTYTITIDTVDASGNHATGTTTVVVTHSRGRSAEH